MVVGVVVVVVGATVVVGFVCVVVAVVVGTVAWVVVAGAGELEQALLNNANNTTDNSKNTDFLLI